MVELDGQVALVTGGTRGVGRGIAERFLAAGAEVVVCGRTEPTDAEGAAAPAAPGSAALPRVDGRPASFVPADVRDPEEFEAALDAVLERHGRLDVLVVNAGGTPPSDPFTVSPRFHAAIVGLNLVAPLQNALAAERRMRAQDGGGSIVFISSAAARLPDPVAPAYAAAKAGLASLTTSLAQAFAPAVRVNCVTVGLVATEQADLFYPADVAAGIPMGRLVTPEDVGNACLLLSDRTLAAFITGADLACHGGRPIPWLGDVVHPPDPAHPGGG
jgi:NAD(P)-dependent dehydrogenase (short-subunit alcohol dehydrogenase family)